MPYIIFKKRKITKTCLVNRYNIKWCLLFLGDCVGEVCLIGGNAKAGNLHIRGKPVCHDQWDMRDAHVACRSMGFEAAIRATTDSKFVDVIQ